jgi:K+-transporting ATPase KdpF subunit
MRQENLMPALYLVGAIISSGLFVYLVFALLKPEMFS